MIPYWVRSGDKAYMGIPVESRCPFFDYRILEAATQLPASHLIRTGWHKWILRKALEDRLPGDVVWRKRKMGYPFPFERFYENYRDIIALILTESKNPYIDFTHRKRLKKDWRGISFIYGTNYLSIAMSHCFIRLKRWLSTAERKSNLVMCLNF